MRFTIKWLGQGGYQFQLGDKELVVDPYLSDSVNEFDGLARLVPVPIQPEALMPDLIVCTHDHIDHLDQATLKHTDFLKNTYAGPENCLAQFRKMGIPEKNLRSLNRGESLTLGEATIHGVFAEHTADSIGLVIQYQGTTLYVVADSTYEAQLLEASQYNPDVLICCINGKWGNMNYTDAAKLAKKLGVKVAIPGHYGMFAQNTEDPAKFTAALAGSPIEAYELQFNQEYSVNDILAKAK